MHGVTSLLDGVTLLEIDKQVKLQPKGESHFQKSFSSGWLMMACSQVFIC